MYFNPNKAEKERESFLKAKNENKSKFTLLKRFYEYVDKVGDDYSEKSVCQKGCSFCCKIPVLVTRFEADYIAKNTKYNISLKFEDSNKLDACPFLDNESSSCKVYEYRPLNCRTFFTFDDPKYCEEGTTTHAIQTMDNYPNDFKELLKILFDFNNNGYEMNDIRNYFK